MKLLILCFGLFLSNFLFAQTESNPVKKIIIGNDGNKAVLASGDTVAYKGTTAFTNSDGLFSGKTDKAPGAAFIASGLFTVAGSGLLIAFFKTGEEALFYSGCAAYGLAGVSAIAGGIQLKSYLNRKNEKVAAIYLQPTGFSAQVNF